MVIIPTPVFIPIIPDFTPHWKIEITHGSTTTDVTARTLKGEFTRRILRLGIGQFKLKLNNMGSFYSGMFEGGDTIKFYADFANGTTQKFYGVLDSVKEDWENKHTMSIEGRHISYLSAEKWISYETPGIEVYSIANDIIDIHFPTYTHNNVSTGVNTSIKKSWDSQPTIKIFEDLCILGSADGYVDDNLDVHLFVENSIFNEDIAIVQGINMTGGVRDFGEDIYLERQRITVSGDDGEGLPVLYTSGTGDRQMRPVYNTNVTDTTKAQELADALLTEATDVPPQGRVMSRGLPYVNAGENIIISSPRQSIHGAYKIIELRDLVGKEIGTWRTECLIEEEFIGTTELIETRIKKEGEIVSMQNPNNLEYSFNMTFDDDTLVATHSNTETTEGRLQLQSGQTSGTMTSVSHTSGSGNNVTPVELRIVGSDLTSSTVQFSVDNVTWQSITKNILTTPISSGKYLRIRVNLVLDSTNPNPLLESLALLYK